MKKTPNSENFRARAVQPKLRRDERPTPRAFTSRLPNPPPPRKGSTVANAQRTKVARAAICVAILVFAGQMLAADFPELAAAARPMEEGVPQVAVLRLRTLLSGNLAVEERPAVSGKLGEALLAAGEAQEALKVLQDPTLLVLPATR